MELYAGNERAHRHVKLPGLEGDVIALPSEGRQGGDLYALFSCGADRVARIVLADAAGHGFSASRVAGEIHGLLHQFGNLKDAAALLAALNDAFSASPQDSTGRLRLTTVVAANFDRVSGEFSFAYAAHPRMLWWREKERRWRPLGEGLEALPLGVAAGERYGRESIRLEEEDMVMAFSDALTEVRSPEGSALGASGLLAISSEARGQDPHPISLHDFSTRLLEAITRYHGSESFKDDLTLLALRRSD